MKFFKPRKRKEDSDGRCLTHHQIMLMEPCEKCMEEDWNDLMAERDRFAAKVDELILLRDALSPTTSAAHARWEARIRRDEQLRVLAAAERYRCMGMGVPVILMAELRHAIDVMNATGNPEAFIASQEQPDTETIQ
jgi:thiamine pyrophosphate-dependent acetolactate synthase large subunit-like protein